jgi:hypothetical protein
VNRDLLVALSLANLCFIEAWSELLFMPPASTYFLGAPRQASDYAAAVVDVLGLTAVLWVALRSCRRGGPHWLLAGDVLGVLALLLPLNALRLNVRLPLGVGKVWHWIGLAGLHHVAVVVALVALFVAARWHRALAWVGYRLLLLAAPFCLLTLGRAMVTALTLGTPAAFPHAVPAPALPALPPDAPRVVWLLFDELDESMIASKRPLLALPQLDRLRDQAFYATKALPPSDATLRSIPALLSGRIVADAQPRGPSDLQVTFAGESASATWGDAPNVFCRARASGFDTALVGWYHPYCRELAACLGECFFEPVYLAVVGRDEREGFLDRMRDQALAVLPVNSRRLAIRSYRRILERALLVASRPEPGLVFAHFSVPHVPAIFDRAHGRFTWARLSNVTGYVDNLALVDRTVGELRRAMESCGVWDRTTVLLTADHAWRESAAFDGREDREVPFMLKLAGQRQGEPLSYWRTFNTVLSTDLVLAILRREVRTPAEVSAWLDGRSLDDARAPSGR